VRHASLCGKGFEHRKVWLEMRLELLTTHFGIEVCGFAILDNHMHVLCRLDPGVADGWSDEEVIRRWIAVYPPPALKTADAETVTQWVKRQCEDSAKVAQYRERLQNLGWFMKALKEPLARLANKEDGCKGAFWDARYKSIAVLDECALLTMCTYIDLNPLAAGIAKTPEDSPHTSIRQRVNHVRQTGAFETLQIAARAKSVAAAIIEGEIEQSHWLCPLQDRSGHGTVREGMLTGFSLSGYLDLVDWTARVCRTGKARMSDKVAGIMDRLGTMAESWRARMQQLLGKTRLLGNYFSTRRDILQEVARRRGLHHVDNAIGAIAAA
jgi:REP element-mobilizing transposase RayT